MGWGIEHFSKYTALSLFECPFAPFPLPRCPSNPITLLPLSYLCFCPVCTPNLHLKHISLKFCQSLSPIFGGFNSLNDVIMVNLKFVYEIRVTLGYYKRSL